MPRSRAPSPAPSQELDPCFATQVGSEGGAVFGPGYTAPVVVSNVRREPITSVGYPFPSFTWTTDNPYLANAGQPVPVLVALKGASQWRAAGATFDYEITSGAPFTWRLHASGAMTCLTEFHHFPEGDLIATPYLTKATDLAYRLHVENLGYAWIGARSDMAYSMEMTGPDGTRVELGEPAYYELAAGDWTIRIPELTGSDASVSAMIIDLPVWATEGIGSKVKAS